MTSASECWSISLTTPDAVSLASALTARSSAKLSTPISSTPPAARPRLTTMTLSHSRRDRRLNSRGRRTSAARQAVTGAAHGLQPLAADLAAEVAHVDLHRVRRGVDGGVPHVVEQLDLADHLAGAAHQVLQEGELPGGEHH